MNKEELDQISNRWSHDAKDVHILINELRRPPCERAIKAVMECDENERDLIRRLCESFSEISKS